MGRGKCGRAWLVHVFPPRPAGTWPPVRFSRCKPVGRRDLPAEVRKPAGLPGCRSSRPKRSGPNGPEPRPGSWHAAGGHRGRGLTSSRTVMPDIRRCIVFNRSAHSVPGVRVTCAIRSWRSFQSTPPDPIAERFNRTLKEQIIHGRLRGCNGGGLACWIAE